ncbi:hypothetical protein BDF19DRAFT_454952 [Syncephalis fuscata]|nr:hypothetical protein BDF19DRAFT_454952 [Syncephalis fuscata]
MQSTVRSLMAALLLCALVGSVTAVADTTASDAKQKPSQPQASNTLSGPLGSIDISGLYMPVGSSVAGDIIVTVPDDIDGSIAHQMFSKETKLNGAGNEPRPIIRAIVDGHGKEEVTSEHAANEGAKSNSKSQSEQAQSKHGQSNDKQGNNDKHAENKHAEEKHTEEKHVEEKHTEEKQSQAAANTVKPDAESSNTKTQAAKQAAATSTANDKASAQSNNDRKAPSATSATTTDKPDLDNIIHSMIHEQGTAEPAATKASEKSASSDSKSSNADQATSTALASHPASASASSRTISPSSSPRRSITSNQIDPTGAANTLVFGTGAPVVAGFALLCSTLVFLF